MEEQKMNDAFIVLFENVQKIFDGIASMIEDDTMSGPEKKDLIHLLNQLNSELDVMKKVVPKFDIRVARDPKMHGYGRN